MAESRVNIDDAAIHALVSDWNNDVGRFVADRVAEIETVARALAPVGDRPSKYAAVGYLKSRVNAAYSHDESGQILGLVGIPVHAGSRYPLPFVSNEKGVTLNRGHASFRPAANHFLTRALDSVMPASTLEPPARSIDG